MNGIMKQTMMNGYATYEMARHEQTKSEQPAPEMVVGKCSGFSMMAMGVSLLMCVGIILYALLTV